MLGSSRKPSSTIIFGDFGGGRSHPRCPCLSRRRRLVSKHSASKVSLHLRSRGVLSRVWSLGLRQDHQVRPQAHLPGSCEFCSAICLALWAPRPLLQALCALRPTSSRRADSARRQIAAKKAQPLDVSHLTRRRYALQIGPFQRHRQLLLGEDSPEQPGRIGLPIRYKPFVRAPS